MDAPSNPRETPVAVIGASTAGLATAAWLAHRKIPHVLLEKAPHVGDAWRHHYERLHLHTHKAISDLPFLHYPRGVPRYPSRQQVVEYLERYVQGLGLAPRFGEEVRRVERDGSGFRVQTARETLRAASVVVATGFNRAPHLPTWPGLDGFPGEVLHSSAYWNGERFRGQRVLVVGFGNSACEIALCLHEHGARPTLAVKGAVNIIPRDVLGIRCWPWASPAPGCRRGWPTRSTRRCSSSWWGTSPTPACASCPTDRWSRSPGTAASRCWTSARWG